MSCRATYTYCDEFLTTSATNTFSITTLLHGLSAYILVCHMVIAFALHFLPLLSLPFSLLIIFVLSFEVFSSLECHLPYCPPAADFLAISVKNFVFLECLINLLSECASWLDESYVMDFQLLLSHYTLHTRFIKRNTTFPTPAVLTF